MEQHRSDRVAEQRGGLRLLAFSQVVLLVTIGLQLRLNISHGRWTPWGVLLLLPAVVVALTLILVRLRCFGRAEPAGDGTR